MGSSYRCGTKCALEKAMLQYKITLSFVIAIIRIYRNINNLSSRCSILQIFPFGNITLLKEIGITATKWKNSS